ncbi:MAG: NRDE family protein [Pseudomonadota bacterium]|nr:NRDE family protein [Pseudomonadota bacterium]
MCLILLAWKAHPRWRLLLAANRDERHDRASSAAGWWPDLPTAFGGRDLVAGGSWLGVTRAGRFAAITNHRDLRRPARQAESRGALVRDFLAGTATPAAWLAKVESERQRWLPFNLLVGDGDTLACLSTEAPDGARVQLLHSGLHGISNHLLDTPWPKVRRGTAALQAVLASDAADPFPPLLAALADRRVAADHELPDTGLPLERERQISAAMIVDPVYGTRCATVLALDHGGAWRCLERSFDPSGALSGEACAGSGSAGQSAARAQR